MDGLAKTDYQASSTSTMRNHEKRSPGNLNFGQTQASLLETGSEVSERSRRSEAIPDRERKDRHQRCVGIVTMLLTCFTQREDIHSGTDMYDSQGNNIYLTRRGYTHFSTR